MYYNTKESGARIRQLRIKSGFTQESIAIALNVDRSFYSRIEAGKKGASVDLLIQLSILFNASLDPGGRRMINVKNEIQYILITRTLEDMAQAGFLTAEELAVAKHLAVDKYRPSAVWE